MTWGFFGKMKRAFKRLPGIISGGIRKAQEYLPVIQKGIDIAKPVISKINWDENEQLRSVKGIIDKGIDTASKAPALLEFAGRTFTPKYK